MRVTKKSRLIQDFVLAVITLVEEGGDCSPSKDSIVTGVVNKSLSDCVSSAVRDIVNSEMGNELERYFTEIVRESATALGANYHLVNDRFYTRQHLVGTAKSSEQAETEAKAQVVGFGSGRSKPATGVRFVFGDGHTDLWLAASINKRIDVANGVQKATNEAITKAVETGALPPSNLKRLK